MKILQKKFKLIPFFFLLRNFIYNNWIEIELFKYLKYAYTFTLKSEYLSCYGNLIFCLKICIHRILTNLNDELDIKTNFFCKNYKK